MTAKPRLLAATLLAALGTPLAGHAQSASDYLPIEPGLRPAPEREVTPPDSPEAPIPLSVLQSGPTGLTLEGIRLDGATAVPQAELQPLWADLLGTEVSVADLERIAGAIEAAYRARGYVLAQALVPAQTVEGGEVEIMVIEGFVDEVEITTERERTRPTTERLFSPVTAERPLRLQTLERAVLLTRDTYGADVETVLEPSPDTFGAAHLGVVATPEPTSFFATLDNRGSRLYGEWTLGGGSRSYDLLGLDERIDTLFAASPGDGSMAYGSAILDIPIAALSGTRLDGGRFELRADASHADPDLEEGGSPVGLTATQEEYNIRAGLIVPAIRTRSQNLFFRAGLGYRESEGVTEFAGAEISSTDRLFILDAQATWDRADRLGGVNLVDLTLRQGLDVGGAEIGADGPAAGELDFLLAALTLSRVQRLGSGGWSVVGEAQGQMAADVLPSSERFSLGNSTIGRGFAPGNTSGDSGFGVRVEFRRDIDPEYLDDAIERTELYAFGDYGRAYDRSAARDGDTAETLASWGIGARIDVRDWLTLTPEIARQIDGTPTDTTDNGNETRFYIGAIARF